jgi:opacity protein-like surface antigen
MKRIALLSVLLVVIAVPSFAAPPNYVALKLGGYLPQSDDMEEFDNSFYGELGFGHYFNQNWAVEMGVGYTKSTADISASSGSTAVSASMDITIIPITLGVKGSVPMGGFTPYATAGIGLYYTKADVSASVSGFGSGSASENDTPFGFYLGLGADFNIAPNVFLGLEGKYFWAEPTFFDESGNIDGINLTANIGYRF